MKILAPISKWIMRISLFLVLLKKYFDEIIDPLWTEIMYYITVSYVLAGLLLIVGGMIKNKKLSIVSSFIVALISVWKIIPLVSIGLTNSLTVFFMILGISLFFLSE